MSSQEVQRSIRQVCAHLSEASPAVVVSFDLLRRKRLVPSLKQLGWGPDYCIQRGEDVYLIHVPSRPELPAWVRRSRAAIRSRPKTRILVVAVTNQEHSALKLAEQVCETCAVSGFGLLCETSFGLVTVLPPRHVR